MFALKYKKSAGVPVTAAVHRILQAANLARERQEWAKAEAGFGQALLAAPHLGHIWIQFGNMAKEQGRLGEAETAYLRAIELRPNDAEPLLQLGHMFVLGHEHAKAGRYYLRAFQVNPRLFEAATALHRMIGRAHGQKRQQLVGLLRIALAELPEPKETATALSAQTLNTPADIPQLVFDISDLIGYFAHGRLPTGIQRVQIHIISAALLRQDMGVGICCFVDGQDSWVEIPAGIFHHIVALSLRGSDREDPDWITALHRLHLQIALSPPLTFRQGAFLVNLGSSWQLHNYFLFVREAKAKYGIRYVPFVHDLIPIVAPKHFTRSARREVVSWVIGMFAHADHILVNSEATRRDLVQVSLTLDRHLGPADVAVIRLDADFRATFIGSAAEPRSTLERWQLAGEAFVLLVSTVESRKGHATALEAWAGLIERHGAGKIPKLVCAGKRGWLSDKVYQRLADDPVLASRVAMLSSVSDAELSLLYENCLFTLYPSLYEGWGLPITESLCYAKPVIASYTSSLPEAGGDFAVYVEPGSVPSLMAAVEQMVFDQAHRVAIADRIRRDFRPRSWNALAEQLVAGTIQMAQQRRTGLAPVQAPVIRLGAYYSLARSKAIRLWPGVGVGEAFRSGTGWKSPTPIGSYTRVGGGTLAIGLPARSGPLRLCVLLLGASGCDVDWSIKVKDASGVSGTLDRNARRWVMFTYPVMDDAGVLHMRLQSVPSDADEDADESAFQDEDTIGIAGFFSYLCDDVEARMSLSEAVAMGDLDSLNAYHDRSPANVHGDDWT